MPPLPPESYDRTYHDQVDPITADKRSRVIPRSNLRRKQILLDVALNAQVFRIEGDFVFFDSNTTGVGTVQLNNTSEDPWPALALSGIIDMPFQDLFITSAAQAGKVLNLWYGYRARFLNPVQAIATIGSIIAPVTAQGPRGQSSGPVLADQPVLVRESGFAFGASFASAVILAGLGTEQILAAASNVNGVMVWDADIATTVAVVGTAVISLHAHTVVPAALTDGNILLLCGTTLVTAVGQANANAQMTRSKFVPAGKGLWWFNSGPTAEGVPRRRLLYTVF
jgi:hypothetical protein